MRRLLPFTVVLLLGCSPAVQPPTPAPPAISAAPTPTPTPSPMPEPTVTALWETEAAVLTQPVIADDVIVTYLRTGSGMVLAGFSVSDGALLWRRAADPGWAAPTIQIAPAVIEFEGRSVTAALGRTADGWYVVNVLDAHTGNPEPVAHHLVHPTSRPAACPDEAPAFCFRGYLPDEEALFPLRLDLTTGLLGVDDLGGVPNSRQLGEHVYATTDRPEAGGTELLGYADKGASRWERRYADVFGAGSSSDGGWSWWDEGSPLLGLGGTAFQGAEPGDRFPLVDSMGRLVALDPQTGAGLWQLPGATHCPFPLEQRLDEAGLFLTCRFTAGEAVFTERDEGRLAFNLEHIGLELAAVETATGDVVWTQPLDPTPYLSSSDPVHLSDESSLTVRNADGVTLRLTLPDGAATVPPAGTVFPCRKPYDWVTFSYEEDRSYRAGSGHYPCDATTAEVPQWTPESLRVAGHEAGGLYIVAGPTGLAGFRIT